MCILCVYIYIYIYILYICMSRSLEIRSKQSSGDWWLNHPAADICGLGDIRMPVVSRALR